MDAYTGLFFGAFLAATVVPAYSEITLAGLVKASYNPLALWLRAYADNTLGSAVNWVRGAIPCIIRTANGIPSPQSLSPSQRCSFYS